MSLILDALRKSERARQQSLTGQLGSAETPSGPGRLPVPWVPLITALLVANAALLFFFWPRTPPPVAAAAVATPMPAPAYHPAVRPLADEAGEDIAPAEPQTTITAQTAPAEAQPQMAAVNPPVQTPATDSASLPSFDALTPEQRQSLPALHMDVHGYAGNPKDRFVVINLKQYHIGDVLDEGPTLKDILPQGAVLEFHGTTFLLPAH
jgi:pyruvate/2-oxoglutarate dehydrogenase complex dihydrolipoamide acyltransferase (E2) component